MSVNVMGTELDGDLRGWSNAQRRMGAILAIGLAAIVLVGALVTHFVAGARAWLDWTLVGVLVLVLAFIVILLVARPRAVTTESHLGPGAPATLAEATSSPEGSSASSQPPATTVATITLRCGDCGTVFDVADSGERPLYHSCPGCGAEGVLKEAPAAAVGAPPPPTHAAESRSARPAPAPEPLAEPGAIATPAAPALRKLKLRCGNCKQVFSIEDTGERPLRRPCPYCARMGEIR